MLRIDNDPFELARQVALWGEGPEVVLEATYGWYRAADVLVRMCIWRIRWVSKDSHIGG